MENLPKSIFERFRNYVVLKAWTAQEKQRVAHFLKKKLPLANVSEEKQIFEKENLSNSSEILSFLEKDKYFTIEHAAHTDKGLAILDPTYSNYGRPVATIPLKRKPDGSYDEVQVVRIGVDLYRWTVKKGRFSGRHDLDAQ
jgi:hypothetical protein